MNGIALAKTVALEEPRVAGHCSSRVRSFDLWCAAVAASLIPLSLIWDFSWESSIGLDRFWSPPHLATHIGVWLGGLLGARLVLVFTLARQRGEAAAGVNIGALCGPAGAWILLWGAATVQAALLLDNWWQQAYGLGAGLWHPPQLLKATGFFTLLFGGVVLCAGARIGNAVSLRRVTPLQLWLGGTLLTMCALVLTMKNYPNWQHTAGFYQISCAVYPAVLLAARQGTAARWGATWAALVYLAMLCAMVWALPLFPARPLTPPIHNPMDHMMPPAFPLLLVVPALVMDWVRSKFLFPESVEAPSESGRRLPQSKTLARPTTPRHHAFAEFRMAGVLGIVFLAAFLPVQWFFAKFLLSPAADNWFFAGGGQHWPFFLKIDEARVMFWGVNQDPLTWRAALLATALAVLSAWIGLRVGGWLGRLRR